MKKSVIFYTTPTSATASIWRILSIIGGGHYRLNRITDYFYQKGNLPGLKEADIPKFGELVLFNTPQFLNESLDYSDYKWILNMRDPRDMGCNQYHWALQHPSPVKSEDTLKGERENIDESGIDAFCLKKNYENAYLNNFQSITASKAAYTFATYALLCLEFDQFVEECANTLEVELTSEHWAELEVERVDNLQKNEKWIGNSWSGSDILPGRFRGELKPSTIKKLNDKYFSYLEFLKKHDNPLVKHTYNN